MQAPPANIQAPPTNIQYVYVKKGPPAWLVTLGVAVVLVGLGGAGYTYLSRTTRNGAGAAEARPAIQLEKPAEEGKTAATEPSGKMAKFLEATAIRVLEEGRKPTIRVVIVNHSSAEMASVKGEIILRASNATAGSRPVATMPFSIFSLGPYEAKEVSGLLKTSLRAYEMPDWQFLKAELSLKE